MSRSPLRLLLALTAAAAVLAPAASAVDTPAQRLQAFAELHGQLLDERRDLLDDLATVRSSRPKKAPAALAALLSVLPDQLDRYRSLQSQLGPATTDFAAKAKAAALEASAADPASPDYADKLDRLARLLAALTAAAKAQFPVLGVMGPPAAPPTRVPSGDGAGLRGGRGLLNCANAFDGASCSGGTTVGGTGGSTTARRATAGKTTGSAVTTNGSAPVKNGATVTMSGANPRLDAAKIPDPNAGVPKISPAPLPTVAPAPTVADNCAHAVNGFDAAHPQHSAIASLCAKAPDGLMWAPPMLAGMVDSIQEQFGSVGAILKQIGFFVLGLMATVATGALGVILKLIALIGAGWAIGRLLWSLQKAIRAAFSAPEGSVERYAAFRSIGSVLTSLAVLVVMVLAGIKYGKSAAMKGMESGVAKAMTGLGLKAAVPGAAASGAGAAGTASGGLKNLAAEVLGPEKPAEVKPPEVPAETAPAPAKPGAVQPPEPPAAPKSMNPETPPPPATPKSLEWSERAAEMDPGMVARLKQNPSSSIAKSFVKGTLKGMTESRGRSAYSSGNLRVITAAQQGIKTNLMSAELAVVREAGLKPEGVISHGTNLQGFLGMLMKGKIISTLRQTGVSGETAEVWGAKGLDAGAGYGATTGVRTAQPGVAILMRASPDLKVVAGETLSRSPTVEGDFLAAVISDGTKTIVLGRETLRALAASAKAWATEAKASAYAGDMREFHEWEAIDDRLSPK